jgi:hypothetical protein
MIKALFSHGEENGTELVHNTEENVSYAKACQIIDEYPYEHEFKFIEKTGMGGAIFFYLGDMNEAHAYFQYVPYDNNSGHLFLDINLKQGFLGFFGKKVKETAVELVSRKIFKVKLKELYAHTVESLYEKY